MQPDNNQPVAEETQTPDITDRTNIQAVPQINDVAGGVAPGAPIAPPLNQPEEVVTTETNPDDFAYDLDLDALKPVHKIVRLNGVAYKLNPPRIEDIVDITRIGGKIRKVTEQTNPDVEQMASLIGEFKIVLYKLMPALAGQDIDISLEQMVALIRLINGMIDPSENSALKQYGVEPNLQKKTVQSA